MDQLKRHNKESDLHKARLFILFRLLAYQMELMTVLFFSSICLFACYLLHTTVVQTQQKNFRDGNLRDVARQKVEAARKTATLKVAEVEQPKYRDRASERRIMHNQPDVPLSENVSTVSKRKRFAEGPPPPPSPPPTPLAPGKDDNNVGNKLLKMMGWTEGSGLGAEGDGRVDPM